MAAAGAAPVSAVVEGRRDLLDHVKRLQAKRVYNAQVAKAAAAVSAITASSATTTATALPLRPCHAKDCATQQDQLQSAGFIQTSPPNARRRPCHDKLEQVPPIAVPGVAANDLETIRPSTDEPLNAPSSANNGNSISYSSNSNSSPEGGALDILAVALAVVPALQAANGITHAHDDSMTDDDNERAVFRHQVRRDILDQAVRAQPVEQAMTSAMTTAIAGMSSAASGNEVRGNNLNAVGSSSNRNRRRVTIGLVLLLAAAAVLVGSSLYWFQPSHKSNSMNEVAQSTSHTPSLAPQVSLEPTIINADGRLVFTTTPQLYQAVDAYMNAMDSSDQANANTVGNSTVALQ